MSELADNSFDIMLDKSTIDALLCGEDSFIMTAKMLREIQRVMKVGGVYIAISYGDPESRLFHFEREFLSWDIKQYKLYYKDDEEKPEDSEDTKADKPAEEQAPKIHYIYVCTKKKDADKISKMYFKMCIKQLELDEKEMQLYREAQQDDEEDKEERKINKTGTTQESEGKE